MHLCRTRPRWFVVLVAVMAALVALTGCGSSSKKASSKSDAGATSSAKELGTPNKAAGTPVKIGLISDGKSDAIDNTPELVTATATAKYVNEYLNGINGHPISLVTCETHQTPSGATDCATKMVEAKVAAVLNGVSGQGASIFKGLTGSNIPLIVYASIDQDTLLKPGAFVLTNGLASAIAGPAGVAREHGVKRAGVIVTDVPAATGPVKAIGGVFYKNAGVQLDIVSVPPGTADMTPQIQSELANKPGQLAIIGDAAFCTSALKATKTLGFTGGAVLIPQCIDEKSSASIPGGYKGMTVLTSDTTDPSDKDYQTYEAVLATYAKGTLKGGVTGGGFAVVLAFQRVMQGVTADITAATVTDTFSHMSKAVPLPLGAGITFQCGTKPVAITPNICASSILTAELDEHGQGHNFKTLDTADITKL